MGLWINLHRNVCPCGVCAVGSKNSSCASRPPLRRASRPTTKDRGSPSTVVQGKSQAGRKPAQPGIAINTTYFLPAILVIAFVLSFIVVAAFSHSLSHYPLDLIFHLSPDPFCAGYKLLQVHITTPDRGQAAFDLIADVPSRIPKFPVVDLVMDILKPISHSPEPGLDLFEPSLSVAVPSQG